MRPILLVLLATLAAGLVLACMPAHHTHDESYLHPRIMAEEGYQRATIRIDLERDEPCTIWFETENGLVWEPLSVPDAFLENGLEVWINFEEQRRPSRCSGQPVVISDIKKREP